MRHTLTTIIFAGWMALCAAALTGCATSQSNGIIAIPVTLKANIQASKILIVRHADRDHDQTTHSGGKDWDPLTASGWQRADDLAARLKSAHVNRIITTDNLRTQQTAYKVEADAVQSGHTVYLDFSELKHATVTAPLVIRELEKAQPGDVVLLVYHHDLIPGLLEALGCGHVDPINDDDYTKLFILQRADASASAPWMFMVDSYGVPFTK